MGYLRIPADLCVKCKIHKRLCKLPRCPLVERFKASVKSLIKVKDRKVYGSTPPSLVVGEWRYPKVTIYVGIPPGIRGHEASMYDNPINWWGKYSLLDILKLRASMLEAKFRIDIHKPEYLYEKEISLAATSEVPVDTEAELKKVPKPKLKLTDSLLPIGPSAFAERLKVVDNPKIPKGLEKLIWDDVKASEAVIKLYENGVSVYTIQRALSTGLLGIKRNRRLVPTRWAITAVDTIISNRLLKDVRHLDTISDIKLFHGSYIGNRFWILLIPGNYRFDWVEIWYPRSTFSLYASKPIVVYNYENWRGKYRYLDGGYQAARLSVLEYLAKIKRRAHVVIVREITPEYYASVGNWHIRESVKNILEKGGVSLKNLNELFSVMGLVNESIAKLVHEHLNRLSRQKILDNFM